MNRRNVLAVALIALALVASPARAQTCHAGALSNLTVTYTITGPTTDQNNLPLSLPITYNIYLGTSATALTKVASGVAPNSGGTTVYVYSTGIKPGATYYGAVTAQDANGEGVQSNVDCKTFPADTSPPGAPTNTLS